MSDPFTLARRFYKQVELVEQEPGFAVLLDGKTVKTPEGASLTMTTRALGEAVAAEWSAQVDEIDSETMPMTGLANATIDRIAPRRQEVIAELLPIIDTDTTRYLAHTVPELNRRQAGRWAPVRMWFEETYGLDASEVQGLRAPAFDEGSLRHLDQRFDDLDDYVLAGLYRLITLTGSLILGFAALDRRITGEETFELATMEATFQLERWGQDDEAERRQAVIKRDILAAGCFIQLSLTA